MFVSRIPPIRELVNDFLDHWKSHDPLLRHNKELLEIYDGDLLPKIKAALKRTFTTKDGKVSESYYQIEDRIVPINILQRVVEKKSKIYQRSPVREVIDGNESDKELLSFYTKGFHFDRQMNIANEYFNLFEYCAIEPVAAGNGRLVLRPVPNDAFLPFSCDGVDPTRPTHFIVFHGTRKVGERVEKVWRAYSDTEWILFNEDGDILRDEMAALGNEAGVNPYGRLNFIYINRDDQRRLIPKPNTDILTMSILIPLLLSDLSFALKFQAFSIMYGINVKDTNLHMAPNAMWFFDVDPGSDQRPEIGTIKPEVDSDKALAYIQAILSMWLQSMGIRPGAIGQLTVDNFASGVSKMIDEMDTSEDRQKQTQFFGPAEQDAWDLILRYQHPVWRANKLVENSTEFTSSARVVVSFPEQLPAVNRKETLDTIEKEINLGLEYRIGAMKRLNPHMTQQEVEERLAEIDEAKAEEGIGSKALNGIQVASMVDVVAKIAAGEIPRDSGIEIISVSFALDRETATRIVANAGAGFSGSPKAGPSGLETPTPPLEQPDTSLRTPTPEGAVS